MIAYFILAHRYPDQFKRMFRAVYAAGNQYLIHIDRSSGPELQADLKAFLAPYQNVAILDPKPALWGGYSLVDAELRGMAKLLKMDSGWTHFINLSGQDFPLKSQEWIAKQIKGAKLEVFEAEEGGSHFMFLENPEKFNKVVGEFLG